MPGTDQYTATTPANVGEIDNVHRAVDRAFALRSLLIARSRDDDRGLRARLRDLPEGREPEQDAVYGRLDAEYHGALNMAERLTAAMAALVALVRAGELEARS